MSQPVILFFSTSRRLIVYGILIGLLLTGWYFKGYSGYMYVLFGWLAYRLVIVRLLMSSYIKAVRAEAAGDIIAAEKYYTIAQEFFLRHSWLDKLRVVFLMSPTVLTIREMAETNLARLSIQQGRVMEGESKYRELLLLNSKNRIASDALKNIEAVRNQNL